MTAQGNRFGARATLAGAAGTPTYYRLDALDREGITDISRLPVTAKVLLENALRRHDGRLVGGEDVRQFARCAPDSQPDAERPCDPARLPLQGYPGVPPVED